MPDLYFSRFHLPNNNKAFNKAFELVANTRTVLESTDSMSLQSQNLWWESRNYALMADSNAYRACILIQQSLLQKATGLISLLKADTQKDGLAQSLEGQIQQLVRLIDSSLQKKPGNSFEMSTPEQQVALSNVINQKLQSIKTEEKQLLATRRGSVFKMMNITRRIVSISNILMLILLTGSFVFIFYHFRIRQKTERKLIESENRFRTLIIIIQGKPSSNKL